MYCLQWKFLSDTESSCQRFCIINNGLCHIEVVLNTKSLSQQLCMQKIRMMLSLISGFVSSFQHGPPLRGTTCSTKRHLLAAVLLEIEIQIQIYTLGGNHSWVFILKADWCGRCLGMGFLLNSSNKRWIAYWSFVTEEGERIIISVQSVKIMCL